MFIYAPHCRTRLRKSIKSMTQARGRIPATGEAEHEPAFGAIDEEPAGHGSGGISSTEPSDEMRPPIGGR